jgi:hypothetical protein
MSSPGRKPGDLILDRYLPHADKATRDRARENLYRHVAALMQCAAREVREEVVKDSPVSSGPGIIPESPP